MFPYYLAVPEILRTIRVAAACAIVVAISGCTMNPLWRPHVGASPTSNVTDNRPLVLTTFTVIADMARNLGGNVVRVESITKPGAEVHGYEPTPSDLKNAHNADLILSNGFGFERWLDRFTESADVPTIILTEGLQPVNIHGGEYNGKANPHAWMSPIAAQTYIDNIQKALTHLIPQAAEVFSINAAGYTQQLDGITQNLRNELASLPPAQRVLASCEGAFSYLARDFNLTEAYLWAVNQEGQGTPRQVANLINTVRAHNVPAVFCESTVNPTSQQQVANESGAHFGGILYVDSLSNGPPVADYLTLLRYDIQTILSGLTT
jgi:manganese transport system substrate-binding protein